MKTQLSSLALALLLTACGGGSSAPDTAPPAPPPTLAVSAPADQILAGGAPLLLTASVSNGSAVSWQLAAGAPGTLSASSGNSVSYTPPPSGVTASTEVAITASAGGASKQFTLTVHPDPGAPGLSLLAGSAGQQGFTDGKGTAASFTAIQSVAADSAGGYYVYDGTAERLAIRQVSAGADVRTIYDNRAAYTDISYSYYSRLAAASDGMLYVLAWPAGGRQIVRIPPAGAASVVLSGTALANVFNIAKAGNGAIYLITSKAVLKMSSSGAVTTVAGDPAAAPSEAAPQVDGVGDAARFQSISAAGADAEGNLLLQDGASYRRMSASGAVTTVALPALADKTITSIAGGPDGAFRVLARWQGNRYIVYKVTRSNETSEEFSDNEQPVSRGTPLPPSAVVGSDGRLLLATSAEIRLANGGQSQSFAGVQEGSGRAVDGAPAEARFAQPDAIGADRYGNLYVLDHPGTAFTTSPGTFGVRGSTLRKITPSGQVSTIGASDNTGSPTGLAIDRTGTIYFSDAQRFGSHGSSIGSAIYKITADGRFSVLAGCAPDRSCFADKFVDGAGPDARFKSARVVGIDADGNVYAEDSWSTTIIRKIAPDGATSTVAALPAGVGRAPDGNRYLARLENASDITGPGSIIRVAPNGSETVVASGIRGRIWVSPAGPSVLGLIAGETVMKLVLPH